MTHREIKVRRVQIGTTYTVSGKAPYEQTFQESYIKWDFKEDFQRLVNFVRKITHSFLGLKSLLTKNNSKV